MARHGTENHGTENLGTPRLGKSWHGKVMAQHGQKNQFYDIFPGGAVPIFFRAMIFRAVPCHKSAGPPCRAVPGRPCQSSVASLSICCVLNHPLCPKAGTPWHGTARRTRRFMARHGTENHGTEKYWHGTARKILARRNNGTAWPGKKYH